MSSDGCFLSLIKILSLSLYISFFFGATHVLVLAVLVDIYAERSNKLHMCKWYLMLEFFPDALDFAKTHWWWVKPEKVLRLGVEFFCEATEHSCKFSYIWFSNAQHNLKQNNCLSMYSTKRTHLSENIIRFIEADIRTKAKIWTIFLPSLHRSSQRTVYTLLSRAFNRLSRIPLSSSVRVRFINCVIIKLL